MAKVKFRVAIEHFLSSRVSRTSQILVSHLVRVTGNEAAFKTCHDKLERGEKVTDEEDKLLHDFFAIDQCVKSLLTTSAVLGVYAGVNAGSLQPTIFVQDEQLEDEIDPKTDPDFRKFCQLVAAETV